MTVGQRPPRTVVVLAGSADATAAEALAAERAEDRVVIVVAGGAARSRSTSDSGATVWWIPIDDEASPADRADLAVTSRRRRAAREQRSGAPQPWGRRLDQVRREIARRTRGRSERIVAPILGARDALSRTGHREAPELALGPVIDAERPDEIVCVSAELMPVAASAARRATARGASIEVSFRASSIASSSSGACGAAVSAAADAAGSGEVVLGVGPANSAGQGAAWAAAVRRADPSVRTEVIGIDEGRYPFPSDVSVSRADFDHDAAWGLAVREQALRTWTHALIESGRSPFGLAAGSSPLDTVRLLRSAGITPGLVFHGSDIRDPDMHAATQPDSPFPHLDPAYVAALRATTKRNREFVAAAEAPVFVSTPDQLQYLPEATWLPVVVDLEAWPLPVPDGPAASGSGAVPLVVHAPSNPRLKGTAFVEAAVRPLIAAGRIRYEAVTGVSPAEAAAVIRRADIVIDQLTLGLYGVLACEALACGSVVIAQVGDALRSAVPEPVPILEATPASLSRVLSDAVSEIAAHRAQAAQRRAFVERFHSGWYSAEMLLRVLTPSRGPTHEFRSGDTESGVHPDSRPDNGDHL